MLSNTVQQHSGLRRMDKEDSQRDGSTQQDRGHILLLTLRLGLRVLLRGAELEHDLRGPRRVGLHLVPERAGQAEVRPSGGVARVHGQPGAQAVSHLPAGDLGPRQHLRHRAGEGRAVPLRAAHPRHRVAQQLQRRGAGALLPARGRLARLAELGGRGAGAGSGRGLRL